MDFDQLRLILWIIVGLLMLAGVVGVALSLLIGGRSSMPVEAPRSARRAPAPAAAVQEILAPPIDPQILEARRAKRVAAYRLGILIFIALAILTAIEFVIATAAGGSIVFLFLIALVKAGLIIQYYMHLRGVWSTGEAH